MFHKTSRFSRLQNYVTYLQCDCPTPPNAFMLYYAIAYTYRYIRDTAGLGINVG